MLIAKNITDLSAARISNMLPYSVSAKSAGKMIGFSPRILSACAVITFGEVLVNSGKGNISL
jgi:hypothetical protein